MLAQAIVSSILFADKVHNFAAGWMRDTIHVMWVTGISGATAPMVLLVTHQFVICVVRLRRQAVRCGCADRPDDKISRTAQVVTSGVLGSGRSTPIRA